MTANLNRALRAARTPPVIPCKSRLFRLVTTRPGTGERVVLPSVGQVQHEAERLGALLPTKAQAGAHAARAVLAGLEARP